MSWSIAPLSLNAPRSTTVRASEPAAWTYRPVARSRELLQDRQRSDGALQWLQVRDSDFEGTELQSFRLIAERSATMGQHLVGTIQSVE